MGFKIQCQNATIRPASRVLDHNRLSQMVEVDLELIGSKVHEDLFFRLWELVDSDDLDSWLASEGYSKFSPTAIRSKVA